MSKYVLASLLTVFTSSAFAKGDVCELSMKMAQASIEGIQLVKSTSNVQALLTLTELAGKVAEVASGKTGTTNDLDNERAVISKNVRIIADQLDSYRNSLNSAEMIFHERKCSFGNYENFKSYIDARNSVSDLLN